MRRTIALLLHACMGCSSEPPAAETSDELVTALAEAKPGDTVRAAAGDFEGSFRVPAGVRLCGDGRGETTLRGPVEEPALVVEPGEPATRVCDLTVEWTSPVGIVSIGGGSVKLERVDVSTYGDGPKGIGVGAEGLDTLTLEEVFVEGPATAANADDFPTESTASAWVENWAAYGVLTIRVASAELDQVEVTGFAAGGLQLVQTAAVVRASTVRGNLGVGILVYGGSATFEDVEASEPLQGRRLTPPDGLAILAGADVSTVRLRLDGGGEDAIGLQQHESRSRHESLVVSGNRYRGVVVQSSTGTLEAPSFEVTGEGSELSDNGYVSLLAAESTGLRVEGALVSGTEALPMLIDETNLVMVGDGVQIHRCGDPLVACASELRDIELRDLTLEGNGRAGLLVSGNVGSASGVSISDIRVSGSGDGAFGAVYQLADPPPSGWVDGITRDGGLSDVDAVFQSSGSVLDEVGIIIPDMLPTIDELARDGIEGAIGPIGDG